VAAVVLAGVVGAAIVVSAFAKTGNPGDQTAAPAAPAGGVSCVTGTFNPYPSRPTRELDVTPTDTPTNTPTNTPTDTPTNTPTNTPVPPTSTPTSTPTNTPAPSGTPTSTPTPTTAPTCTPTSTPTNTPTSTPTNTPTNTPTPAAGKVTGGGTGTVNTAFGIATFGFNVQRKTGGGAITGSLTYTNPGESLKLKSTSITSFVVNGTSADFSGTCKLNNVTNCTFTVHVEDNSQDGSTDVFLISINGGAAEGGTLRTGNIQIHS
jgi:hypothetical protein